MRPEPHELQELVRDLHRQATPWLPAGSGSRLEWGPPVQPGPGRSAPLALSTARLDRIVEHNPGDFTVTVQTGTPLVVLQQELARHRQWLTLDWPWGTAEAPATGGGNALGAGTVGGLVARGLAGGYRQRHLGVRDQLIGIGLLRADGTAARAGGKVVKNVAGYDLMRLLCGSWGSLALITEVTLRTQPLPPQRRGLWLHGPLQQLQPLARWLLGSSLSPERIDWHRRTLPDAADAAGAEALLVSLASISPQTLEEQVACIRQQADQAGVRTEVLDPERLEAHLELGRGSSAPRPAWLLRAGVPPRRTDELLRARELDGASAVIGAGSGLGDIWGSAAQLPAYRVEALRRRCRELGGHLTVLRQPPGPAATAIPAWLDAPSRPLIETVKRQFDPKQQLARGRLPGVQPPP
ncbi:FAD-binding oxidoreductase [Cyanobium sp. CH-040]|uniref:FAD-binding oxidoreductase n=1 Tax=Cyanobium sp. CH-040 TaxID=2823708 RepID=UPI0021BCE528|nr:FAD-binding oxidoreductase [Cyanobium sp. CH-040]